MEYLKQTNTQKQKADWQSPEYGWGGVNAQYTGFSLGMKNIFKPDRNHNCKIL